MHIHRAEFCTRLGCGRQARGIGLVLLTLGCGLAHGQAVLDLKWTPTVEIRGVPGSVQEVQYSTSSQPSGPWTPLSLVRINQDPTYYTDTTANGAQRFYRSVTVGLADTNLVWIPPGTFVMGSPDTELERGAYEGPQTTVTITRGFLMGRFEVRNLDYIEIIGSTPKDDSSLPGYLARPVRGVRWTDATNYCVSRTAADLAAGKIPPGWAYRLPTEVEWEYACRAGTTNAFNVGASLRADGDLGVQATFNGNYPYPADIPVSSKITFPSPTIVGSYAPNGFGLYDMHGNVDEWCLDGFVSAQIQPYPGGSVTNYLNNTVSLHMILRGGGYNSRGKDCRSAARRTRYGFTDVDDAIGFRVVLAPVAP